MKCIYCHAESDLTESDIISCALTGAKLKKRFVCRTHNAFTNDNYEKKMHKQLDIYRNLLGLTERDGKPVRFTADLDIGEHTFKNTQITDRTSVLGSKRSFSTILDNGTKIVVGDKENLLKISGACEEKIDTIDGTLSYHRTDDLRELFVSDHVLHAIAKIAYEWHCYVHNIEDYHEELYSDIVQYILTPNASDSPVEIVSDAGVWKVMDDFSRTGTNMLFEYQDCDGSTYVIFGLWDVILYKVRVCHCNISELTQYNMYEVQLYHADGNKGKHYFGVAGPPHILSESPEQGLARLSETIKNRMSKLGERDLSIEYLKNNLAVIKPLIPKYKNGKCTILELLDYGREDRVIPVYMVDLLWKNRSDYISDVPFYENLAQILNTDSIFRIDKDREQAILQKYVDMDKEGTFCKLLEDAIDYFESVCITR